VSSSAQYYTAQAQQATPSSAQYTQYLSPVSQQPQQQPPQHHQPQPQTQTQFQPNPTQQAGQAAYTSPPQANLNSPFSRQQYAQYTQQQTPTQNFQQQSQYSQPQQTNAYSHLQYSQAQHPQVQKLKSPPLQSSQLQSPVQSHKAVGQSQQPVVQAHLPVVQHQQPVVQSQPLPAQPQQLSQPRQAQPQVQQAQQQVQQQVQQQTSQPYQPLQPLPYALLPQNPLSNVAQPPTPISLTGSPAPSITNDYFESYINRTLKIQSPCPTPNGSQSAPDTQGVSVVPPATNAPIPSKPTLTIAPSSLAVPSRYKEQPNMERLSPDPIAMDVNGPSPAKKRKSNSSSRQSPPATPQKQKSSSFVIELKTLTPEERKKYKSLPTLSDFDRSTTSMRSTPATRDDESDDDLDWNDSTRVDGNGDWDMSAKFLGVDQSDAVFVTPTSGRTGDKDDRTSFQKLQSLMEDIFEESDTFSADLSIDEVSSSKYFAGLSVDGTQPNLSSYTIDKLIRYFTRLEDNKKRQRSKANAEAIPWDVNGLLRLFRMLDKTMRDAEEVDPFPSSGRKAVVAGNPSPKKKKGGKKAKDGQDLEASPSLDMTEEELEKGSLTLRIMKTAAASAVCCLTILDSKTMPKQVSQYYPRMLLTIQLYSEDLLLSAVKTVRDQMTKVIFPVVEGLAGESEFIPQTAEANNLQS
jgi:cohesin loading factor subunit SCC2